MTEEILVEGQVTNNSHEYYKKIIDLMPCFVYWVDESCSLQGFNAKLSKLLNIKSPTECKSDPYLILAKSLGLGSLSAQSLKLDDMEVIFSKLASRYKEVSNSNNENGDKYKYFFNREPMLNDDGKVIGAVVSIFEKLPNESSTKPSKPKYKLKANARPKVLIVEDNLTAQKVEAAIFTTVNCDVDAVRSEEEALKLFKPGKYSLVIMDIGLENSSGYLLTRKFRKLEKDTDFHTVIIALTSYEPDNVKSDCDYYAMEGVVGKPLTEIQANQIIERFVYNKDNFIAGFK